MYSYLNQRPDYAPRLWTAPVRVSTLFVFILFPIKGKYGEEISKAPIVHISGDFYLVSGYSSGYYETTIGRFDLTTQKWSLAGNLVSGRMGHNAIYDGRFLFVVGGHGTQKTEKCTISNKQVVCMSQMPELTKYSFWPELFLVPAGFCKELP